MSSSKFLVAAVRNALREVVDPELGYNIVDLGFIYGIAVEDGVAQITMTATSPGCPVAGFLSQGAVNSALRVPGVTEARVAMTFDPPWEPSRMASAVREALGVVAEA